MSKSSFKRKVYLTIAASSFLFRRWSVRKKLHLGFASLILVLVFNVILTAYEISRLKDISSNLSYLIYLDLIGIVTGCLFIWIISQSVLRPMQRIIHQLENRASIESLKLYSNDEIGQLARAVSYMKKNRASNEGPTDEKNLLLETILGHSIESIFVFNDKGKVSTSSKGFKSMTRYNANQESAGNVSDVFINLDLSKITEQLSSDSENTDFFHQRVALKTKKGKNYPVDCSICKVNSQHQDIYIGILKELHTGVKIKEHILKVFSPFSLRKKAKS